MSLPPFKIVAGYATPPQPAPEFKVEYIDTPQGAIVTAVYSAMGERLPVEMHPRFQYWLRSDLQQKEVAS